MAPILKSAEVNGIALAYWDWPADPKADPESEQAPILLTHATGFHARCYDALIEHFADRRVIAVDMRGHGQSGGGPVDHWQTFADDIAGLCETLELQSVAGVGHSMGAHTLLQVAVDQPDLFTSLVLFDPVIMEPTRYDVTGPLFTPDNPHPTAKRKRDFASVEDMMERFVAREPYALFEPRVFADYCTHGLVARPDGDGMELACAPEMEASVYGSSLSNAAILETARTVQTPVTVVRAKQTGAMDFKGSPTWPDLASILPNGTDLYRPDRTHFHPFEDPADAAAIVKRAIASG